MAESESLDAVLLHQQDDELKQLHGDEGDKSSGGGVKDFKPVVERDEKEEAEEGGEDDGAGDGEGGEDETRTVVSETEEGAVSLSSMPEEKSRNLSAAAAAAAETVPENDQCIGSAGNSAPEALTEAEIKERVGSSQGGISECGSPREAKAETNLRLQLCVSPASATELSPTSVTQPISAAPSPAVPEQRLPSSKGTGAPFHGADQPKASELSPTSVTQPISSAPSRTVPEQKLPSSKGTGATLHEADQPKASDTRKLVIPVLKTAIPDGYNWRKYGQKQVKSPTGSRSYYRCTHSDCVAKKIECSDHCGRVVEVVNKGMHSHDPPRKSSSKRVSRIAAPCGRVSGDVVAEHASRLTEPDPATPSKEPRDEKFVIADRKRSSPSGSGENAADQIKQEHACVPEPKKRAKKDNLDCSGALTKPGKKPKFVVHAADDVGISGDGYRWRKYGQKMVKGNTHPRNYYRCTSAGCPVRKHIESAADNSSAVIITYKGVHDHDMPVPKKRQRPPSAPLVAAAAAAAASVNNALQQQQNKSSEPALRDTNDKPPAESAARALVSIGFEIKPC